MKCANNFTVAGEELRLKALHEFRVLDTEAEQDFDDIVGLAADLCHTPIALISFVDHDRQWFKAKRGLAFSETSREVSFCSHAIQQSDLFIVPDTLKDERFSGNPLVRLIPGIRFYAGVPLKTEEGHALGTLCVMDIRPRELSPDQLAGLRALGRQVMKQLRYAQQVDELSNQKILLQDQNQKLHNMNQELQLSEAEIRSNLEEICALKRNLELQEYRYRELVEGASDLIYELDAQGKFIFANRAMEVSVGFSREELAAKIYWELVHPDDRDRVIEFYKAQRKNLNENSYLQFKLYAKGGEEVWIGQSVRMFFQESGYVYRVNAISRDITELKRVEHKLKHSEKRFRLLSEHAPVGIFQTDSSGKCVYVNKRWSEIVGISEQQAHGDGWINSIYPDDRDEVFGAWLDAILEHREFSLEFRFLNPDGRVRWVISRALQLTEARVPVAYIGTIHDITELKEAQEKLAIAKNLAEEATLAKSQFLSMMSHEIRTPMNGILGLTNLLLNQQPRQDQVDNLQLLRFSGVNLLTIINDILDFSKIEAGKIQLEMVNFDLRYVLAQTKALLVQRALEKNIDLGFHYDESLPMHVQGDPVRLTQIVTNLVGNAIKFTEKGKVELHVTDQGQEEGKHKIHFVVQDTGIGIDPAKIDLIFEPFAQADNFTTRKYGGTGLGLSITKDLVELMGSKMMVYSEPGRGSTFAFTLLLAQGVAEAQPEHAENFQGDLSALGLSVLVVDDNHINQIIAANFLASWGVEVDLAANGKEAFEKVQQKEYQLILMDIQMPVMDGYEATRSIRSMEGVYYQHVPILALTASAMLGMRDRVMAAGMNDFIPKPFVPEELYAKIQDQVFRAKCTMTMEVSINLDLDRYANGDITFKHKLSQLFVANIEELQHEVERAVQGNDAGLFRQVLHKNKMTLQLVKNSEFALLIERMNKLLTQDLIPWSQLQILEVEFKWWCMRITREVLQH